MIDYPKSKFLIVSRHKSTQELLKGILDKLGIKYDVIDHVEDLEKLNNYLCVIGNIPLSMFLKAEKLIHYIQVNLEVPRELRGKELSIDEVKKYVSYIWFWKMIRLEPSEVEELAYNIDVAIIKDIDRLLKRIIELGYLPPLRQTNVY